MLLEQNSKRLGIFFFYDKDGIVDSYVSHLLSGVSPFIDKLMIVCNGELSEPGKVIFDKYSKEIILRENIGFDVGAYKEAFEYVGYDHLKEYGEIVIFNHTIMGPVYPMNEMFEEMAGRDVDFWGITKYGEESFDPFGYSPYGYLPEHIQSHFLVFRKSLVQSEAFIQFWQNMPVIKSYDESVGLFESVFTKKFADQGFQWDVYVNTDDYKGITTYPLMNYPKELIMRKKCPIFKRRTFFQPYDYVLGNTVGQSAMELLDYLKKTNLYDVDMIWENILRTCHQADFVKNMQLQYVLPSNIAPVDKVKRALKEKKVALIMHLYFEDLIDSSFAYAQAMPEEADIYITTDSERKKNLIEKKFAESKCRKVEVRMIQNRGRDVSSILVGVKDIIMNYDVACFAHDKKTAQVNPGSVGEGFAYKCFENTLHNEEYVYNIIHCFLENERLGLLVPPAPNHGDFFPTLGLEWSINFENTCKLARSLGIMIPMDKSKEPIAPLGTFFWFRPKAFKYLYAKDWEYEDFPKEPNNTDGTLLHAIERIYPFAVQQAGYYPAFVLLDKFASIELNNLEYYVREYNKVLLENHIGGYQHVMVDRLKKVLSDDSYNGNMEIERKLEQYQAILDSKSWKSVSKVNSIIDKLKFRR